MLESVYQAQLIKRLKHLFPGSYVLKNDSSYLQGVPDLLVLWGNLWAMLEVKAEMPTGPGDYEPNQEWYIEEFDNMSFAAMICPENEEEVLHDLFQAFGAGRAARHV